MPHYCARAAGALAIAVAEAHVLDPVRQTEVLVHAVGPDLAAAVLGLAPPGPGDDVLDLLVGACGVAPAGAVDRLRVAVACVTAVEASVGDGAGRLWLRLPDPVLGWDPPGLVLAAADPAELEQDVIGSAVGFILEATVCDCGA